MSIIVQTKESIKIREGAFVPLDFFAGYEGFEIEITDKDVVTIWPKKQNLSSICQSIDRRREALKTRHGWMKDSSLLIREDRDNR